MRRLLFPDAAPLAVRLTHLSPRQREVLDRWARGETVPQIAAHLYLAPKTVEQHLHEARERLGVGPGPGAGRALCLALGGLAESEGAPAP